MQIQMNEELIQTNQQKLNRLLDNYLNRNKKSKLLRTPLIMSFLVTNKCSLKCKHCFNHEALDRQASQADAQLSIDEYEKISKSFFVAESLS